MIESLKGDGQLSSNRGHAQIIRLSWPSLPLAVVVSLSLGEPLLAFAYISRRLSQWWELS